MVVDGMALLHREVPVAKKLGRDLPRLFHEQRMRMRMRIRMRIRMIAKECAVITQRLFS
jgi:hypothetical protein